MKKATRYALAFLVISACGGDATAPTNTTGTGGNGATGGTTGGTTGGGTVTSTPVTMTAAVTITDDMFTPTTIRVLKGGTVTWTWNSGLTQHNVTFDTGETSGDMSGTSTYEKTFTTTGTFGFQCTNHYGMTGVVVVQ